MYQTLYQLFLLFLFIINNKNIVNKFAGLKCSPYICIEFKNTMIMKTVNVMVMLQMDIPIEGNELDNIQTALDFVNNGLARDCDANYNTQLFVNSIDKSDITYPYTTEFEIGDSVEVPDPDDSDIHNHSFVGTIVAFDTDMEYASVEDGDGDCFDIEIERLTHI